MTKLPFVAALLAASAACAPIPGPGPFGGNVAGTSWRVAAVNGRATPAVGEFFMRFDPASFGSKFGCNGIGADYVQRGDTIDPGPTRGTMMACPDMSYEIQANAILQRDMRAVWIGPNALNLGNGAGLIELRR